MNTYLFSIHPKWCEKIFNGEKTIEVRKTAPKPPFKVVVYCTKGEKLYLDYEGMIKWSGGYHINENNSADNYNDQLLNGKVIGEFICERVSKYSDADLSYFEFARELNGIDKYPIENGACLTIKQMHEYSNKGISAIEITAPVLYDKPKELESFNYPYEIYCEKGLCGNCIYEEPMGEYREVNYECTGRPITHAPQSYMRIEEV